MCKKNAIVVGSSGQDGQLLANYLKKLKYEVIGINKNNFNIFEKKKIDKLVRDLQPDEIYFLAAYHSSSERKSNFNVELNYKVNYLSTVFFLDSIRQYSTHSRFFYASSSFIFKTSKVSINETTEYSPSSLYGLAKVASMNACKFYRENYKIFACVGILFNHESKYRKNDFLSKKIVEAAVQIYLKKRKKKLHINNLQAKVDWGFAPDYVDAIYKIINVKRPSDFIVATGKLNTVKKFAKIAFSYLDLDFSKHIEEEKNQKYSSFRVGDSSYLKKTCDWNTSISFQEMVEKLVSDELESKDIYSYKKNS